jgi:hypothetical protein
VGSNRRGSRTKRPPSSTRDGGAQGWELTHSPYSPAGEIEGAQRFAQGFSSLPPRRRRRVRAVIIVVVVVPLALALVSLVGRGSPRAGTLAGAVRFTGGPAGPGRSIPQEGIVTLTHGTTVVSGALHVGPDGGYRYRLAPGDYTLRAAVGELRPDAYVRARHTTHVDVVCHLT